jgi:membrane protease YdiL (CAAX protease family)
LPADFSAELSALLTAAGMVAVAAAPVAAVAVLVARRLQTPLLPRWRYRRAGWEWPDVLVLFVLNVGLIGGSVVVLDAVGFFRWVYGVEFDLVKDWPHGAPFKAGLWGSVFAAPMVVAAGYLIRGVRGRWSRVDPTVIPARVALAVAVWVVVTPVVFGVNLSANWVVTRLGGAPDKHPLTQIGAGSPPADQLLLGLAVCLAAPLAEEFLFRGVLLPWATGRRHRPVVLAALAVLAGFVRGGWQPAVMALVLLAVLLPVRRRTYAAVYSTALLFAVAHGGVWPSPVPLFVLGLALGYLAARTGGITACVLLHGLFNAVSCVYLLRGGPA